jgi:hypothetical protein
VIISCQEIELPRITNANAVEKQPFLKCLFPCPQIKDTISKHCPLAVFNGENPMVKS